MDLTAKKCMPCNSGTPPLTAEEAERYLAELQGGWTVIEHKKIQREFKFKNFKEAMAFVNRVADIAEHEGHHPDIYVFYNLVRLELWTHAVRGLSENDFIVAAKIDNLTKG